MVDACTNGESTTRRDTDDAGNHVTGNVPRKHSCRPRKPPNVPRNSWYVTENIGDGETGWSYYYSGMANRLGIDRRNVTRKIKKLQEEGRLRRIGATKNGYWLCIEETEKNA